MAGSELAGNRDAKSTGEGAIEVKRSFDYLFRTPIRPPMLGRIDSIASRSLTLAPRVRNLCRGCQLAPFTVANLCLPRRSLVRRRDL
jgi:hypothetical protein